MQNGATFSEECTLYVIKTLIILHSLIKNGKSWTFGRPISEVLLKLPTSKAVLESDF